MILADKIIRLRKKNGWSQEELAEKMNVSRQAVSKWEGAQTVPDLGKVLQLSQLFGVTTDYLLKDEIEDEEFTDDVENTVKRVTLQEANEFIQWRQVGAVYWLAATAVYLGWSFWTNDWYMTWMVWPIAGVPFAGVMAICNLFLDRNSEK